MADADLDHRLIIFRRQYLQLFEPDFLAWPPVQLLETADVQTWLCKNLFDSRRRRHLPPYQYQSRVLKTLIGKLNPGNHDQPDSKSSSILSSQLGILSAEGTQLEVEPASPGSYVTFTCLADGESDDAESEAIITISERRHLVSGSQTTGYRTWEGALHLATYLLSRDGQNLIRGKNVLELGAGTGLLAILCSKRLEAAHITATDGDEGVVEALEENFALNNLGEAKAQAKVLRWGDSFHESQPHLDNKALSCDVVIGADVIYNPQAIVPLVETLRQFFDMKPRLLIVIAGVVRNTHTFAKFEQECVALDFVIEEVQFRPRSMRAQRCLFYAAALPVKIIKIRRGMTRENS